MKLMKLTLVLAISMALLIGCGINKDEHMKVQKELADTKAADQMKAEELAACIEKLNMSQKQLDEINASFQVLDQEKSALDQEKSALSADYTDVKEQLAKIKKANELRQKAMDELLSKFEALIKSGKLSIGINDGRMVIQLPSKVLFKVGKSRLSKKGKKALLEVAEVLKTIEGRKFQIAGHTDDQRGRSRVNPNWTLSYKRARSVFDLIVKAKMDESMLSIGAYAEYSPVASNDTKEGKEANRRIEIVLLPTSDELPLKQMKKIKKVKEVDVETAAAPVEEAPAAEAAPAEAAPAEEAPAEAAPAEAAPAEAAPAEAAPVEEAPAEAAPAEAAPAE